MPTASNAQRTVYRKPNAATRMRMDAILEILEARTAPMGVRQIFYQMETRGLVAKNEGAVNALGRDVAWLRENDEIPWDQIIDDGSQIRGGDVSLVDYDPREQLAAGVETYRAGVTTSRWVDQPNQIQVWIEKEGLVGTVEAVTNRWHVPLLSGGGSPSLTLMHDGYLQLAEDVDKHATILMLYDHDPAGYIMAWTIENKYRRWDDDEGGGLEMDFVRLALTRDQVEDLNLSHAKRATKIKSRSPAEDSAVRMGWPRGSKSVELDAIPQATLQGILEKSITALIDAEAWAAARKHREARAAEMSGLVDDVLGFIGPSLIPRPRTWP